MAIDLSGTSIVDDDRDKQARPHGQPQQVGIRGQMPVGGEVTAAPFVSPPQPQSIEDLLRGSDEQPAGQPRPLPIDYPAPGSRQDRKVRLASLGFPNGVEPAVAPPGPAGPQPVDLIGTSPVAPVPSADHPAPAPQRSGRRDVTSIINDSARAFGLDPDQLARIAHIESGGDPNAATGSYRGLFQLGPEEWNKYGRGGNIFDPVHNSYAAAAKMADERDAFTKTNGRVPDPYELYLVHQQGQAGYAAHMQNLDAPAWENMASTGEGRAKGARWARQAIWGNVPDQEKRRFGSVDNVTSRDFIDLWRRKIEGGAQSRKNDPPILRDNREFLRDESDQDELLRKVFSAPPEERRNILEQEIHAILGVPVDDRAPPGTVGLSRPLTDYPPFDQEKGFGDQTPLPVPRPAGAPDRPRQVIDVSGSTPVNELDKIEKARREQPLPGSMFDYAREALLGKPKPPIDVSGSSVVDQSAPAGAKDQNRVGQPAAAQPRQEAADQTGDLGLPGLDTGAQSRARVAPQTAPASDQGDWGGYLPVASKSLARGAVDIGGKALKGADVLAGGPQPLAEDANALLDEIAAPKSTADRVVLMRKAAATLPRPLAMDFNAAMIRVSRGSDAAGERGKLEQSFKAWNEAAAKPKTERPLYQAGEAVERFGKETFPLTPAEEQSITGQVAQTVGAMGPLVAGGAVLGPGAALAAGAGTFALSSAADTFDDAISKGAEEKTAAKAAGLSALVGGTIGVLPLGAIFAPVKREAPGLMGWAAAKLQQAATSGVTFATVGEAQHWLGQEIAKAYYDPKAEYSADVRRLLVSLASGSVLGVMHPVGKAPDREAVRDKVGEFIYEADRAQARAAGAKNDEEVADFIRKKYADQPQPGRGKAWRDEIDEFLRQRETTAGGGQAGSPKGEEPPAAGAAAQSAPEPENPPGSPGGGTGGAADPLYEQAKKFVVDDNKASTSYLQRKLRLKYGDAAAIMSRLEADGVVSAVNKYGKRTVIRPEESAAAGPAAGPETGPVTPVAGLAGDQPSAEPVRDLLAQAEDLKAKDNQRQAVWLPKASLDNLNRHSEISAQVLGSGTPVDNFDGQGGTLIAKDVATADAARYARDRAFEQFTSPKDRAAVMQGLIGRLTGAGDGKPADATHVVQQVTPEGAVSRETVVTADQVPQAESDLAAPGREVRTVAPEAALGRREDEIAAETPPVLDRRGPPEAPEDQAATGTRAAPHNVATAEDMTAVGAVAEQPKSQAQADAGNYQKEHLRFAPDSPLHGLKISIETAKGQPRQKVNDETGEVIWREEAVPAHYGHFVNTAARSADGEHPDVMVGDDPTSDRAFVINQFDPAKKRFDETKTVVAVRTVEDATKVYDKFFSDGSGPSRRNSIVEMSVDRLQRLLEKHDWTKPVRREKEESSALVAGEEAPVHTTVASVPDPVASDAAAPPRPASPVADEEAPAGKPPSAAPSAPSAPVTTGQPPSAPVTLFEARNNLEQAKNRARELQRRLDALNDKLEQKPPTPRNALDKERIDKNRAITERIARGLRRKTAEAFDAVDDARAALKRAESEDIAARQRRESEAPAATGATKPERQPPVAPAEPSAPPGDMPDLPEFLKRKKETASVEQTPHAEAAEGAEPAQVPVPAESRALAKDSHPETAQGPQGEVAPTEETQQPQPAAPRAVDDLFREFPDKTVRISGTTDEGTAFIKARYDVADDGTITPRGRDISAEKPPPPRVTEAETAEVFRLPERMTRTSVEEIAPRAASLSPEEKQAVHDWIEREFDRMEKDGKRIEKHCLGSGKRFSIK